MAAVSPKDRRRVMDYWYSAFLASAQARERQHWVDTGEDPKETVPKVVKQVAQMLADVREEERRLLQGYVD
jgi:hypothetical protein